MIWFCFNLVAKNAAIARETAKILQVIVQLMNLHILEAGNVLNMPVSVADVVLTQRVLDQIDLILDLDGVHFGDDYDFAELAQQVLVVGQAERRVVFVLFVHLEIFVRLRDDQRANLFFLLLLLRLLNIVVLHSVSACVCWVNCSILFFITFVLVPVTRRLLLLIK